MPLEFIYLNSPPIVAVNCEVLNLPGDFRLRISLWGSFVFVCVLFLTRDVASLFNVVCLRVVANGF